MLVGDSFIKLSGLSGTEPTITVDVDDSNSGEGKHLTVLPYSASLLTSNASKVGKAVP
jgi:hypothetical protein